MKMANDYKQLFSFTSGNAYAKPDVLRLLDAIRRDVVENLPDNANVHDIVIDTTTATCNTYYTMQKDETS